MGLVFLNKVVSAAHQIHLLEFSTYDGQLTYGEISKQSNSLDGTNKYNLEIGLDTEYYLKIVSS